MSVRVWIAIVALAFMSGWNWQAALGDKRYAELERDYAETLKDAVDVAFEIEQRRLALANKNAELDAQLEIERKRANRVVTERVIEYVQSDVAGQCDLPNEWVRVHDAAAGGVSSVDTAAAPDDGAATITDAAAIVTIAGNYELCRDTRAQLIALQRWVSAYGK